MHTGKTVLYMTATLALGGLLTWPAYNAIVENELLESETAFMLAADSRMGAVKEMLNDEAATVAAMTSVLETVPILKQREFSATAERLLQIQESIYNLAWAPHIAAQDIVAAEQTWRDEVGMDFAYNDMDAFSNRMPLAPRDDYYPIHYIQPRDGAETYMGTDISAGPLTKETVAQVLRTGQTLATTRLDIIPGGQPQAVVLFLSPIRRTADEGKTSGILISSVILDKAIEHMLGQFPTEQGLKIQIKDITDPKAPQRLFPSTHAAEDDEIKAAHRHLCKTINVFGRSWYVSVYASEDAFLLDNKPPQATLFGGLLLTLFGMAITYLLSSRHAALENEVLQRTEQLQSSMAELGKARDEAVAGARARTEFLANMSHEIRTPLNGVLAATELLSTTVLNGSQKNYVEIIHTSGDMLLAIINDILDYSKLNAGKMALHPTVLEATHAAEILASIFRAQANAKKLTFAYKIDPPHKTYVLADHLRLRQVIVNLVSNAIKYTPSGRVDVSITFTSEGEQARLRFEVKDTGPGVSLNKQQEVFEQFTQLNNATSRNGTGLGLAICKSLIELMHGRIGVTSDGVNGSTFWFEVPVVIIDDPKAFELAAIESAPEARDHKDCRVLLVEDVDTNRLLARELLQKFGCIVDTAVNGKEALQALEGRNYDIVFMDCQMPIMNGFDATRLVRERRDETIIVALTAHAFTEEIDRCMAVGMNDFISKPINSDMLKDILDKWHHPHASAPHAAAHGAAQQTAANTEEAPILDPQFLRDLCEAIPEKAGQIMELSIKDAHKLFGELQSEMAAIPVNVKEAGEVAHALKSAVRQIGGERLARACQNAERASKDDNLYDLRAAFAQIRENFEPFIKAVESEASRLTFPPTHT